MAQKSPFDSSSRAIERERKKNENGSVEMKNQAFFSSNQADQGDGKRERAFELFLPVLVKGRDIEENKFKEKTQLLSISAEEAILRLRSRVAVGSRLDLDLEIPKTLILENYLRLQISGTVILSQEEPNASSRKRLVSVRLDRKFKLVPVSPNIH